MGYFNLWREIPTTWIVLYVIRKESIPLKPAMLKHDWVDSPAQMESFIQNPDFGAYSSSK